MNENPNMAATLIMAISQLQQMKDKIDPEVYSLLQKSAHEAISSAHTFLDACEKVVDSLASEQTVDLTSEGASEDLNQDVVDFEKVKKSK